MWQAQKILFVLLDDLKQTLIIANVGRGAMHKVRIPDDVHQQMSFDPVRAFIEAKSSGFALRRVRIFRTHRIP